MSSYSSMASVYSSMVDDISELTKDYDVLSGHGQQHTMKW